jgi:hypothetical protein
VQMLPVADVTSRFRLTGTHHCRTVPGLYSILIPQFLQHHLPLTPSYFPALLAPAPGPRDPSHHRLTTIYMPKPQHTLRYLNRCRRCLYLNQPQN